MKYPEDDELLDLFSRGSSFAEKAFTVITQKYGRMLYWQIRRMIRNQEHTSDILQNVFVKVWLNLSNFNRESTLYVWMYRIAHNETLNFIQKEKKHQDSLLRTDEPILEILEGHAILDQYDAEKIASLLQDAIEILPEKQAQVFHLKYFEDLKYSEISSLLGTSEGALKASYSIATQKIQEFILSKLNH